MAAPAPAPGPAPPPAPAPAPSDGAGTNAEATAPASPADEPAGSADSPAPAASPVRVAPATVTGFGGAPATVTGFGGAPASAVPPDTSSSPQGASDTVVIGAAAAVVSALLLLVVFVAACMCCRRRRSAAAAAAAGTHAAAYPYWGSTHSHAASHAPHPGYGSAKAGPGLPYVHGAEAYEFVQEGKGGEEPHLQGFASLGAADGTVSTSGGGTEDRTVTSQGGSMGRNRSATGGSLWTQECVNTTFGMEPDGEEAAPPPDGATVAQKVAWAHHQLDSFGPDEVVLGRFKLLGPNQRRQGGALICAPGRVCCACCVL